MGGYTCSIVLWLICFRIAVLTYCTTTDPYDIRHGKVMGEIVTPLSPCRHVPCALNRPAPLALHTTYEKFFFLIKLNLKFYSSISQTFIKCPLNTRHCSLQEEVQKITYKCPFL